jgi:serine/threonine protein phosphatase PrpC
MSLEQNHRIQNGDIIVVATDGLLDNMDERQIVNLVAGQKDRDV